MPKNTLCELPVTKLHNVTMSRMGVEPMYEVVFSANRKAKSEKYMVRVTCQMSPSGEPVSALGHYAGSIEVAKQKAAAAFMNKFVDDKNPIVEYSNFMSCDARIILENVCLKNNLGEPQYTIVSETGLPHSKTWVIKCQVSDLTSVGTGSHRSDAQLDAVTKMIRNLTETGASRKNCKSKTPAHTNVVENCVLSEGKSGTILPGVHPASDLSVADTPRVHRNPDTTKMLFRLLNEHKKPEKIRENGKDSEADMDFMEW